MASSSSEVPRLSIVPRALQQGECIAFVSPSARYNEIFEPAVTRAKGALEALGYRMKIFWTPQAPRTVAQSIAVRIAELRAAFVDADVHAIICTIGGSTATELLPTLIHDKQLIQDIRDHPKIFVGYSDITVLHWALAALANLRTFYGPTAIPELGALPLLPFTMDNLLRTITSAGTKPLGAMPQSDMYAPSLAPFFHGISEATEPMALATTPRRKWLRGGKATGVLFGGCMPILPRILGVAAIAPSWAGKILILETALAEESLDVGYRLPKIKQVIADLAAVGVFDEIAGLVIGRCIGYDSPSQLSDLEYAVADALAIGEERNNGVFGRNKPFPVLMHADFGHTNPMLTLPMGAMTSLDSEKDEFAILEATVI